MKPVYTLPNIVIGKRNKRTIKFKKINNTVINRLLVINHDKKSL